MQETPTLESRRLGWSDLRQAMVEVPALPLAAVYFFCLLCGYYVLRPVRDAMGASPEVQAVFPAWLVEWTAARGWDIGDFTLQALFTCTFIAMLLLQPLYGALVSRYARRVFLPVVYAVFIVCLLGFYAVFERELPGRGVLFFVWVAVFNLFAVSVFWSYISDVFSNQAARLFYGFIGVGGTLGAITGPLITRFLAERVGVANLMLISVGFLILCLGCILLLGRYAKRNEQGAAREVEVIGGSFWAGLRIVLRTPLLRAFALLMFFGVGVGTLLYNEQAAIARQIVDEAERARFYAGIDFWINVLTLTVQLVITPLVLFRYGAAPLILIPAIAITLGYGVLAAAPLPFLVAVVQIMTRAGEFSMSKPARETIYTRVDRESRYKAKAFIDTAVYRGGDLTFVWVHKAISGFGSSLVLVVGIFVALGMTFGAWRVGKEQAKLTPHPEGAAHGQPSAVHHR